MAININLQNLKSHILIVFSGIVCGIAIQFNWLSADDRFLKLSNLNAVLRIVSSAVIIPVLLLGLRASLHWCVRRSQLSDSVKEFYRKYDALTYTVFLLFVLGAVGIIFTKPIVFIIILLFLLLQFLLVYFPVDMQIKKAAFSSPGWLSFLFLVSGFAALIYQIVWQRVLFAVYGVNIESVTIVVSIFMFGLGIGSIAGGILSKKFPLSLPHLFFICEIIIGLFGIISLPLIKTVGAITLHGSLFAVSLAIYGLLFIPTMFMGATLPILVAYLHKHYENIGKTIGILYFINTLGSAIACFVTADLLFVFFGQQSTVIIAALFNFTVGFLVYKYTQSIAKKVSLNEIQGSRSIHVSSDISVLHERNQIIRFFLIMLLSFATGYITLSQEILWIRAISYSTGGKPDVFAHVLAFFLFGIAFGALAAKKICEKEKDYSLLFIPLMLSVSAIIYYLSIPISSQVFRIAKVAGIFASYLSVGIVAFLTGGIFPIACHFAIKSKHSVGFSLSWIYFANILGATSGSLLTGFILMNSYTMEQNVLYICIVTLIIGGIIWMVSPISSLRKTALIGGTVIVICAMFSIHSGVYSQILEKLQYAGGYSEKKPYKYVIQNRSGIIAVEKNNPDIIYGGGVYDGRINLDPVLNINRITRAYMVASLHPNPEEVLEIGLSGGAWARVVADNTSVKKFTIVEINPGYLEIIKHYPDIATVLTDPKVTVNIDDGRRWLNRNPDAKFDYILMNTTYHWRSYITHLVSEEFLKLCKNHLKPGGVMFYNATGSEDILFTAARVFKFIARYDSFVAVSDRPFSMTVEEKRRNLLKFQNSGKPNLTESDPALRHVLENLATHDLSDKADEFRKRSDLWFITDDNMATEFKSVNRWFNSKRTWRKIFEAYFSQK